jgi:YVTN family beta-propeller protein
VTNKDNNTVSVINGATGKVTATIGVGIDPYAVAVDPSTDTAYVTNENDGTVSVINGATNTVTATIGVGTLPVDVAEDPSAQTAYVANAYDNTVSVISGTTNTVTATIGVGRDPDAVGVDPSTDTAYVTNEEDNTVSVITYNPPSSYPSGYHQLVAHFSELCVDVYGARTSNNTAINQYTCKTTGQANQEWRWNPVSGGYGELQNQNSGKDLVVANASTAAGAKIIQYDQNGTTNGLWKPIALPTGSWRFQNENSGQCLDVPGYSTSPAVQLDQQPCPVDPVGLEQTFDTR